MHEPVEVATTPVIPGFFPDPSLCRVGEDYYLVNSSFEFSPGIPLWRSRDLVSWTHVGHVVTRPSQFAPGGSKAGRGLYAPTIRHRDGRLVVVVTDVDRPGVQLLFTAVDPAGPWSEPVEIVGAGGIDPDLAWLDDGACVLTWCALDEALRPTGGSLPVIAQARIDLETGHLLEPPRVISTGSGLAHPEGPHLIRRGDWWYLLTAEGGTERGHAVCVSRSRRVDGPFEQAPLTPLFTRRSTGFEVQNTGHADLVERPDGSWAMVYLGVRPRGVTPSFHVNGRESFIARVDWVDDWPVVSTDRALFIPDATGFTDDFAEGARNPRYLSAGYAPSEIAAPHPGGGLALRHAEAPNGAPSALSVRTRDLRWRFEAEVDATAGPVALRVRLDERHWYELRLDRTTVLVEARIGPVQNVTATAAVTGDALTLVVEATDAESQGPDDLRFGVRDAAGERWLDRLDGRYLSTEVAGGFTGRTLALHAPTARPARVLGVRYLPGRQG